MGRQQQPWSARVSRRRAIRGAGVVGAGLSAATLLACNTADDVAAPQQQQQVTEQPKRGGTLSRMFVSAIFGGGNADPHVQQSSQTGLMGLFYQPLLKTNPASRELEPHLAQKWESPAETELVLTLQPGVKWQNRAPANGRLLTAEDVVFSLERMRSSESKFINKALLATVDKIQAVDKSTVKITAREPDVTILSNLGAFSAGILAPEVVERVDKAGGRFNNPESVVGTGAFIVQTIDEQAVSVVRNPDYWKPGMPYLDGVKIQVIIDDQAKWAAFVGGQLDVSYAPGTDAKKVVEDQSRKFGADWYADVSIQGVYLNTTRKPFDDPRVQRALRLLIDHDEALKGWAEVWFGRGYMSTGLPASLPDWDFTQEEYVSRFLQWKRPKDEAAREAIRLLAAAGFTRENPLKFTQNGYSDVVWGPVQTQLLQAQYKRLSQGVVETELGLMEQAVITSSLARGEFVHMLSGQVPAQPFDPDGYLREFYHSKGGRNYGKYSDSKLDALIDKQRATFNLQQRKAVVKEALVHMIDNAPNTPWSGRYQSNVWQTKVKDFAPEANSSIWGHNYERVWLNI